MCVLRVHLPSQLGSQSTASRSQPDRPPMLRLAPPGVESNKPPLRRRRCRHTAAVPAPAPLSEKSQTECHVTKLAKESLCQATSPHLPACGSSPPLPHRHEKVHLFQTRMQSLKKSFCYTIDLSSCAAVKAEVEPNSDSYHGACLMLPCRSPAACQPGPKISSHIYLGCLSSGSGDNPPFRTSRPCDRGSGSSARHLSSGWAYFCYSVCFCCHVMPKFPTRSFAFSLLKKSQIFKSVTWESLVNHVFIR